MFLSRLLPAEGLYCVALLLPAGGFRHYFYPTIAEAQQQITALDAGGHTVYIAQATFDAAKITEAQAHNRALPRSAQASERMKVRSQANAILLKNFFLDIDCGEKWPLKDQAEGAAALQQFIKDTVLPMPTVVNSGNGLYAHWILDTPVPAPQWRQLAFLLKKVVAAYAPKVGGDASRTSDSASVLRVPGCSNRKPGKPEKPVRLIHLADDISLDEFTSPLESAARKQKIDRSALLAPKAGRGINDEFQAYDDVPVDAEKVADRCTQIGMMRKQQGDIAEPLWYACIGVLSFCEAGAESIHQWSQGYEAYDIGETTAKIEQYKGTGYGPSTCVKFGEINPGGCIGCPHKNIIKSPIVLGRPDPVAKEVTVEECSPPQGFKRAENGLHYMEENGTWFQFYPYDLYVSNLAYDESLGYEVTTIKHHLPHDGDMEFTLRTALVAGDPKALTMALADNHIKVVGMKKKKIMNAYLESYQERLQRQRGMSMLLSQMGWKKSRNGEPIFVLGKKIFKKDGTVDDASLARNVPKAAEGYHSKGSLEKWVEATRILGKPGMEPFAFALLAGGFGAPLMKFTGFDGALISLVGTTGVGKTLMLRMIQSIWGYERDLMMLRNDTVNSLISRLGVYGNLPLTLDEVTNIDGMELSDLVYRVTQGRDKARLTRGAEEKRGLNSWNTIAVASTNAALIDKLAGAKHDASAEINRVFEYTVPPHSIFQKEVTKELYWTIQENYGKVGEVYIQKLVQLEDKIKNHLDTILAQIEINAELTGEERFLGALASAAWYGGLVASSLGLIKFDVENVMRWASDTIWNMRSNRRDLSSDPIGILGQFLDEHAANRLLVKGSPATREGCTILEAPRGPLVVRYELDSHRVFFPRTVMNSWIAKRFGSYSQVKKELVDMRVLLKPNCRKVLGAGTFYGGAQQVCWQVDMDNKYLGESARRTREVAESLEKAPIIGSDKIPAKI